MPPKADDVHSSKKSEHQTRLVELVSHERRGRWNTTPSRDKQPQQHTVQSAKAHGANRISSSSPSALAVSLIKCRPLNNGKVTLSHIDEVSWTDTKWCHTSLRVWSKSAVDLLVTRFIEQLWFMTPISRCDNVPNKKPWWVDEITCMSHKAQQNKC